MSAAGPPIVEAPHPGGISADERNWALLAHLASFSNLLIPFGAVLGPLVVWLSKRDHSAFVGRHGKEAVQFQASFLVYHMVLICAGIASFFGGVAGAATQGGQAEMLAPVGMIGLFGIVAVALLLRLFVCVMAVVGAVRAYNGEEFRYPLTVRVIP